MGTQKEDLRIKRTKALIRKAFEEMIFEMDFEQMTVKELTERAMINRKTFYLHYDSLDELLLEMQNELAKSFIERTRGMERPRDIDKITREFFLSQNELGELGERITCSGSYHYISRRITADIMSQTWKEGDSGFSDPYLQNVIMTYVSQSTLAVYKQWVADKKKIPLDDIIDIAVKLVCSGINGIK